MAKDVVFIAQHGRAEPWAFPVYSERVCRALAEIRLIHQRKHESLNPNEQRELADALQVLALAAHLESQVALFSGQDP